MKEIATELEYEWTRASSGEMYWRRMPSGDLAIIQSDGNGWTLTVGVNEIWAGDDIMAAVVVAGTLAHQQLKQQMHAWTAA
ncbi:hypothetical protein FHT44_005081 [Mycolicibacterium sp. BK634]|uniref:hypothetical protein n=1 Tax=Mycolicibacterium sp. BK634 TaxID=2587099 RepID=UPI0016189DD3|nr:hypothetical protein [Mycolicibacterium sp. BK634]MBB3752569.1 hypothetical protein [Mycolicibacterium sp. BK634]